jgi:hypothetical protein
MSALDIPAGLGEFWVHFEICDNFLYCFQGHALRARQAVPASAGVRVLEREITVKGARAGARTLQSRGGSAGTTPTPGRAACGAATRSARPHPQAGTSRSNAPTVTASA